MAASSTQDRFNTFMQLRSTPEARALFRAIAGPEGTLKPDGSFAYYRQFGGNDLDPSKLGAGHPNQVIRKGGYSSAATGFAQFMPDTWNMVNEDFGKKLNFKIPEHQEIAALRLAERRGVSVERLKQEGLTPQLVAKLAPEWASFPTLGGGSAYGQPSKSFDEIAKLYKEGLKVGQNNTTQSSAASTTNATNTAITPAIAPTADGQGLVVSQANGAAPITVNVTVDGKEKSENNGVQSLLNSFLAKSLMGATDNPHLTSTMKNSKFFDDSLLSNEDDNDPIYRMSA